MQSDEERNDRFEEPRELRRTVHSWREAVIQWGTLNV